MGTVCNRKKETHCEAMQLAVDSGVIDTPLCFNRDTHKEVHFRHGVYVDRKVEGRKKPIKTLIYLNVCPWCKQPLRED